MMRQASDVSLMNRRASGVSPMIDQPADGRSETVCLLLSVGDGTQQTTVSGVPALPCGVLRPAQEPAP